MNGFFFCVSFRFRSFRQHPELLSLSTIGYFLIYGLVHCNVVNRSDTDENDPCSDQISSARDNSLKYFLKF